MNEDGVYQNWLLYGCCPSVVVFYKGLSWPTVDWSGRRESVSAKWLVVTSTVWLLSHRPDFLSNECLQNGLRLAQVRRSYVRRSLSRNTGSVEIICDKHILTWKLPWHIRRVTELQFKDLCLKFTRRNIRGITDGTLIQVKKACSCHSSQEVNFRLCSITDACFLWICLPNYRTGQTSLEQTKCFLCRESCL